MRTTQKTNAAVKWEYPPKPKLEKQTSGGCSIKPPLERSSSKLVHITAILLSNVHQLKCSSLKYMTAHLLSTPPSDPLNRAYTNHFTVCWLLLLYNTAVTVAVISSHPMMQLQRVYTQSCASALYVTQSLITEYESRPLYLLSLCVCECQENTFPAAQDYGCLWRCGWLAVVNITGHYWDVST